MFDGYSFPRNVQSDYRWHDSVIRDVQGESLRRCETDKGFCYQDPLEVITLFDPFPHSVL